MGLRALVMGRRVLAGQQTRDVTAQMRIVMMVWGLRGEHRMPRGP